MMFGLMEAGGLLSESCRAVLRKWIGVQVVSFYSSLGRRIQQILGLSQEQPLPRSFRLRTLVVVSVWVVVIHCFLGVAAVAAPTGNRGGGATGLESIREL